jgi:hypothetical protein
MKKIVFCLPGAPTLEAVRSWDTLVAAATRRGDLKLEAVRGYNSSVTHCRNQILEEGITGLRKYAKPFGGADYDFMMWIDSDSVYEPEDFFRLLEADKAIISGMVPINEEGAGAFGLTEGPLTKVINLHSVRRNEPLREWDWCGFAFLLVKRGVFEALEYPWFQEVPYEVEDRVILPGEDIDWCRRVRTRGFQIWAHPAVRIGHDKRVVLRCPGPPLDSIELYDPAWRMSRPALEALRELLDKVKPRKVLELGPGASSFVLLPWCRERGAVYQALDHEGIYAQQHLENLRQAGLPTDSTFISRQRPDTGWYAEIPAEIEAQAPYDLVVVDGPVMGRGCPAARCAYDRWRHARTAWVFDDVNRDDERKAALGVKSKGMHLIDLLINDPDYPRTTLLLSPADIDEQLIVGDTDGNCKAAAFGPPASRGQPEAIA